MTEQLRTLCATKRAEVDTVIRRTMETTALGAVVLTRVAPPVINQLTASVGQEMSSGALLARWKRALQDAATAGLEGDEAHVAAISSLLLAQVAAFRQTLKAQSEAMTQEASRLEGRINGIEEMLAGIEPHLVEPAPAPAPTEDAQPAEA